MSDKPTRTSLAPPPAVPPRRPRVLGWLSLTVLLLPVIAALVAIAALWRGLHTEAGTQWWLGRVAAHVPGVVIEAPRGALLGADAQFAADRLTLVVGRSTLRIEGLRLAGLQIDGWQASAPYGRVQAGLLAAQRVAMQTQPDPDPKPAAPLRDLLLPVELRIEALRIDALEMPGLPAPVAAIAARLELGRVHRLDGLSARWRGLRAEGEARIEASDAMTLSARASVHADTHAPASPLPPGARDFRLDVHAAGPLARFDTQAALAVQGQRIDAKAQVTPFEPLPVSQLDARFAKLDLSRLDDVLGASAVLPQTALDGEAALQLNRDAPLVARVRLRNAEPGRWDRQRLPVAEIDLLARGRGSAWTIERGDVRLAGERGEPAGSVEVAGTVDAATADLTLHLREVLLRTLDERAPPWLLGGPVELHHEPVPGHRGAGRVRIEAELEGASIAAAPARRGAAAPKPLRREPVRLALAATADLPASRYTIDKLQARSAGARLDGRGHAERATDAWQAQAELTLADFDPAPWIPGDRGAAWRRAANKLQGQVKLDARVPAAAPASSQAGKNEPPPNDAQRLLAAMQGRIDAQLRDSVFAGQPLGLQLQADADGRGSLKARFDALAAGNRAKGEALVAFDASRRGNERLQIDIDAPALDKLAPLAQAFGSAKLAGRLQAQASAAGPIGAWIAGTPTAALRTRGTAKAQGIEAAGLALASAESRWDLTLPGREGIGAAADPKLEARADVRELKLPGVAVTQATLELAGSLGAHRANVQASLLPRTAEAQPGSAASVPPPSSRAANGGLGPLALAFDLDGRWQAAPAAGWLWRARWNELSLRPTAKSAPITMPLIEARGIDLELSQSPNGTRLTASPAQAEVLGAVLRWSRAEWSRTRGAAGTAPRDKLDLDAEIEPFRVAPLLQRLQPDFGWGGDLLVAGKATVRSDPALAAQIEIARASGDLSVQEFDIVQSLGLTALRLDLNVTQDVWAATQVIAGETLGRVAGAQTVRSSGDSLVPAASAPVEGAIRLQVDNLSTWGAWVPAGWRLGGGLDGVLTIGGRFGAPELTGTLDGRELALRNALEGVAWSAGELKARFDGETARLETLSFRAGDGRLEARGDAQLGAAPRANLRVAAERATVLGRVDRRIVASGAARLALDAQTIRLDGELRLDEGLVDISRGDAPKLGDDVRVRRTAAAPTPAEVAAPAAPPTPPRSVEMTLAIDLGERFRLRGRGIDTQLVGRLALTSPKGKLAASGEIRTEDGTYEAYGQNLAIERGVITFVGDLANPRLDIQAVRAKTDARVGVIVSGSAQAPRVRLFSEPEMPSTEKLALLVTGRSYDSLGGSETLLLQQAAMAILAGDGGHDGGGGRNFDVARLLKLDELSVRQTDGTVRDTVVTLGKQISDRVYVGYERGLNATAGNWQLIYRIARRFTLRAQSGDDPAVDLIWVFRW